MGADARSTVGPATDSVALAGWSPRPWPGHAREPDGAIGWAAGAV